MTAQTASSVTLPAGTEIFRAGSYVSSTGLPVTLTAAELADIAAQYNTQEHEAPITVGHPAHDQPAYGWVKGIRSDGESLLMDYAELEPQFAELVNAGRFKKRSAAFYTPEHPHNPTPGHWYLRHVGFLGALPPVVKGLKDIAEFCENDGSLEGCVFFSEPIELQKDKQMPDPTSTTTPAPGVDAQAQAAQLQQQIAALQQQVAELTKERDAALAAQKAAEDKLAAQAQTEQAQAQAQIAQFAEGLVKAGKVLPKDKAMHVEIMNNLAKADKERLVEFSEGNVKRSESRLKAYQQQLAGKDVMVAFGEFATASQDATTAVGTLSDEELDKKVREYMAAHPNVSYMDGLKAISQK